MSELRGVDSDDMENIVSVFRDLLSAYREDGATKKARDAEHNLVQTARTVSTWVSKAKDMFNTGDLPKELVLAILDIKEDLQAFQVFMKKKESKGPGTAVSRAVRMFRPHFDAILPALTLLIAVAAPRKAHLVAVLAFFLAVLLVLRWLDQHTGIHVWTEISEAWVTAVTDIQEMEDMAKSMEAHAKRMRQIFTLQVQLSERNKYNVSRTLMEPEANEFWTRNFGQDCHTVATDRFIEALLENTKTGEKKPLVGDAVMGRWTGPTSPVDSPTLNFLPDVDRDSVYATLRRALDKNEDGTISPHEFRNFLVEFGPLIECIHKCVSQAR
eukprot:gb/GEZN01012201.1/.p1 GENE.gb/GEZN01012201.1/~~gb/GEZN01012201.1/.p1  ORF type:complete len:327 (-),score=46.88 gb/GEZN01012201.1/:72-1052(-)